MSMAVWALGPDGIIYFLVVAKRGERLVAIKKYLLLSGFYAIASVMLVLIPRIIGDSVDVSTRAIQRQVRY